MPVATELFSWASFEKFIETEPTYAKSYSFTHISVTALNKIIGQGINRMMMTVNKQMYLQTESAFNDRM